MSEYQYYDFRRIDKPLTISEREAVADLSSRSYVTSHQATFVYNYGDFHGSVEQLMLKTFDMMLYVANWGTQRLMFRLPKTLIDIKELRDYFISDEIEHQQQGDYLMFDLHFNDDDGGSGDWIEGEGLLDDMLPLREELIQGDYRVLYLAWLKAAEKAMGYDGIDAKTQEPTVPAGLDNLSLAQQEYARFIELDEILIATAAKNSPKREQSSVPEADLSLLSIDEKDDFLQRLCSNEAGLSTTLNRHLQTLQKSSTPIKKPNENMPQRRYFFDIYEDYEQRFEQEKQAEKQRIDEEIERRQQEEVRLYQRKLDILCGQEKRLWETIYSLVQESIAINYAMAVDHIVDLHHLAQREGDIKIFKQRLSEFMQEYARRPALIRRLNEKGFDG